ncbi:unnamed protein product [Ectocarpus sp. 8 AP-2014]
MAQWQDPYNIVGFVGGVVLASSLLPQIYLAHKRRSTADISYLWQASGRSFSVFMLITASIFPFHLHKKPLAAGVRLKTSVTGQGR